MDITVHKVEYADVEPLRELYRQEAGCQIVHDSMLQRGLADPYLILADARLAGYGAVRNKYSPGHLIEFYTVPQLRDAALPMFQELLAVSEATHIQAQTNMPLMLTMLYDCAENIVDSAILFNDAVTTHLACPRGSLRKTGPRDAASIFDHQSEPVGDWCIDVDGDIVATAGALYHYNPPYGDIYMEVSEQSRRQGYGSYLVQEVKRLCYEAGKLPAARCNPDNQPSRRTLQKAGFLPCGRLLTGDVA
ncbi:MAG: GNAT family N-acetyltransferase [Capsulimonadaceae bacterium]|nr:GNAT family N-acetyltransferase [Capsulimonadaceae bacterium]